MNTTLVQMPASTIDCPGSVIEAFLAETGIVVLEKHSPEYENISFLVDSIAGSLPLAEDFLHSLRKAINTTDGKFEFRPLKLLSPQRNAINHVATVMKNCGVFNEFLQNEGIIKGRISSSVRVRNFISGIWLELFSQQKAVPIIADYASKHQLPYEIYCNIKVEDAAGRQREIDLIFSIGDAVFGIEIKSGLNFCDYDKYRLTAEWLHLIPDRFLLMNSTLTDKNTIKCIEYFYRYYICSATDYENVLKSMIRKAFT